MTQLRNTYVFEVPGDANKVTVAEAVAVQFNVTVLEVNISNLKGKAKRSIRKGGRAMTGRDIDVKKAFVTLKDGDSIAIFAAEEDKADDKSAKKEKK